MLKWDPCRNDNSRTVYRGTKSSVSVSDEKLQANRDCMRLFLAFVFMTYYKKEIIDFRYTICLKW